MNTSYTHKILRHKKKPVEFAAVAGHDHGGQLC